jgi:import receptor subunit TOM20
MPRERLIVPARLSSSNRPRHPQAHGAGHADGATDYSSTPRVIGSHATPKLIAAVYQKVVPAPIFALVIEISQLSGPTGGPGAGAGAGAGNPLAALLGAAGAGATATPARPQASAADIDDSPVPGAGAGAGVSAYEVADDAEDEDEVAEEGQEQDQDSPAAGSTTSGTSWENVEEA